MAVKASIWKSIAAALILIAPVYSASASNQAGGITYTAWAGGRFFFSLSGTRTGTVPACSCCNRWEVTSSTDAGRALIAMILSAQGTSKNVTITGSGACVAGSNDTGGVNYGEVSS